MRAEKSISIEEKRLSRRNVLITIIVIIFFVGIISFYYTMLYNAKRQNIIESGGLTAKEAGDEVEQYLATNANSLKMAAYTLDEMILEGRTDREIQDFLVAQSTAVRAAVIENSTGLYGYINGRFFSGTNWIPPEGYDATSRPWYTKPFKTPGDITILEPYVDVQSGNVMLALGKVLCDGKSVISVDVSLDQVQKLVEDAVNSGQSDVEMILTDDYTVVAHSDINEVGKNYKDELGTFGAKIVEKLDDNRVSDTYIEFDDEGSHYIVYVDDMRNGWCCIAVKNATKVLGSLNVILFFTIAIVLAVIHVIGFIMKKSGERRIMAGRAIAANEAKSAFLSNMSHEIRTPINTILGMNEMISRESESESVLTYSDNIRSAGSTLLGLVNDILDFSKIESGKIEIIPGDYDLKDVIGNLVNMVYVLADDKDLIINLDIDPAIPRYLNGDEVRIKQVITNILSNAVKYTEKGSVTFKVSYERTGEDPDGILLKVSVTDTGIGIKEEDMDRLFAEFERIEEKRNRYVEGTGLGMSITRKLLALMGSTLRVESTYGKGSEFSFALLQKVVRWEELGKYERITHFDKGAAGRYKERFTAPEGRILVVDDNPMNLMVFMSLVKQTHLTVDTADSGDEGIKLANKNIYDIIFLDHMMPGKDGIQTLHEIKGNGGCPNKDAPVICLTANAIAGSRKMYIEEGFTEYITKPINPLKLEQLMIRYIDPQKVVMVSGDPEADDNDKAGLIISEDLLSLDPEFIDVREGIGYSGSEDEYRLLLKMFYEVIDDRKNEICRYYDSNDINNYTIKVHALKSSARLVGAMGLGDDAQALENAGKADDLEFLKGHHDIFIANYEKYKELLGGIFAEDTEEGDKSLADDKKISEAYKRMKKAAEEMDCDALEKCFMAMADLKIPDEHLDLWKRLKQASDMYDYSGIITLLGEK